MVRRFESAALFFVDFWSKDFLISFERTLKYHRQKVYVRGNATKFERVLALLGERFNVELVPDESDQLDKGRSAISTVILLEENSDRLQTLLHDYIDRPIIIFAPRNDRYLCGKGLFVTTIPKAGTHLLFHLLNEFRLHSGGTFKGTLEPHTWYFPTGNDSHVKATSFFGEIAQNEYGGFAHPLFKTPVIFLYRNPLDVLVAESRYLGAAGNNALNFYFHAIPPERRINELIYNPLLGYFSKRILAFTPWVEMPNVIPICFEELVGIKGNGSRDGQLKAIWSIQLKLQIPGTPSYYSDVAFYKGSPTFNSGMIGSHKTMLTDKHLELLAEAPPEFMHRLGYDLSDDVTEGFLPRFVDRFRNRALITDQPEKFDAKAKEVLPLASDDPRYYLYRGYVIGQLRGTYYAVPRRLAPINPELERAVPHLHGAFSLDDICVTIDRDPLGAPKNLKPLSQADSERPFDLTVPFLVEEGYKGFNIVRRGQAYNVELQAQPLPNSILFDTLNGAAPILPSLEEAKGVIDTWDYKYCDKVPYLLKDNFLGFNIVLFNGRYIAIPVGVNMSVEAYLEVIAEIQKRVSRIRAFTSLKLSVDWIKGFAAT